LIILAGSINVKIKNAESEDKIMKNYIKIGETVYCTGAKLKVIDVENVKLITVEDEMYYDGLLVNWDENGYYTESD